MSKRQEIVDTLNAIDGIKGYPMEPKTLKAGDAWCAWGGQTRVDGLWETTWTIYVVLSTDEAKASEWAESNAEALAEALQHPELPNLSAGYVDDIKPLNLAVGNTVQFGLQITLRSE